MPRIKSPVTKLLNKIACLYGTRRRKGENNKILEDRLNSMRQFIPEESTRIAMDRFGEEIMRRLGIPLKKTSDWLERWRR